MIFKSLKKIILTGALFTSLISYASGDKSERKFSAIELAPGLYMLTGVDGFTGGNIGLSIGEDGVIMIDDSMPPMLDNLKTAIKSITDKPVDFLINTHFHRDHAGNNKAIAETGTTIFAHENMRKRLLELSKWTPKAALPVITFSHSMNLHFNGNDAHIFHVANAHTDGDVIIHFISTNVIHAGDTMLNSKFPYIDLKRGGSIDGYIAAQKKILSITNNNTKIIPGHGKLAGKKDLEDSLAMLIDSRKLIKQLIAKSKSEDEVVKLNPLSKYHQKWNRDFITTEKMTRQVYKSIVKQNKQTHHANTSY